MKFPALVARIASLLLSLFLQVAPLVRVAVADAAAVFSPVVAILRWAVGAVAVAGSFHAVSGATGMTITRGSTSTTVPLDTTATLKGTNGVAMGFRVSISVSGVAAKSFKATGLPPGVNLTSTNQGVFSGTPTNAGTFNGKIIGYQNTGQGGDTATFNVTYTIINTAPTIATDPQPLTVNAGQSASLTVVANGGGLTYRWIKDGIELPLTTPGATNATITFDPAKVSDSGDYQVRVSNSGGNALSGVAKLTVNAVTTAPPEITDAPDSATVPLGGSITFNVAATGEGLTYQWSKGLDPINGEISPSLTINPVLLDSGGSYTVRVSNGGGSVAATAVLVVAPVITAQSPTNVVVHPGEAAHLTVTANGPAPLTYAWKRNNEPVPNSNVTELILDPVTVDNAGDYTVAVSSPEASVTSAVITVTVQPLVMAQPLQDGNVLILGWSAITDRTYRVETAASLSGPWDPAGTVTATSAQATFNAATGADAGFFRIVPQ